MPSRKLISIVEDDQPFRDSMRRLVALLGYRVEAFPSAASFLQSSAIADTACLVTDVNMPGMSGIELFKHLTQAGLRIPTIMVTAYPNDTVRQRALNDGVACYLYKPVDDDQLEQCLRTALQSGAAADNDS